MSIINFDIVAMQQFTDELMKLRQLFDAVFRDLESIKNDSYVLMNSNKNDIELVVSVRRERYINALNEYCELIRLFSGTETVSMLSQMRKTVENFNNALKSAEATELNIEETYKNYEFEFSCKKNKIETLF